MMFTGCFTWKKRREIIGREQKMFYSMIFASNVEESDGGEVWVGERGVALPG